jgi:hypothetical protein
MAAVPFVHLTVHARAPLAPLWDFETASWLWSRLRAAFPVVAAAELMPDHPHLAPQVTDPEAARSTLGRIVGQLSNRLGLPPGSWDPVPPPTVITSAQKLRRHVRYIALNACRGRLVEDPLQWLWSTHLDVMGAVHDPWVRAPDLARALGRPAAGFPSAHHEYVSADPSVRVAGSPPPAVASEQTMPTVPLSDIVDAAAVATRQPRSAIARRTTTRTLFVLLARHQGWIDTAQLADLCQVSRRAVQLILERDDPALLAAGARCLGDSRLRSALHLALRSRRP